MPRYKDVYELAEEVGGMYSLVVAAAKRAKQIREGRQPVIEINSANPLTIAIEELLQGKVQVRPIEEEPEEPMADTEVVEVLGADMSAEAAAAAEAAEAAEAGEGEAESDAADADEADASEAEK